MKNRNKYKRIVGSSIVMLCMVCALLFYVKDTEATDSGIEYVAGYVYDAETYKDNDGKGVAPATPSELSGYLFAGWYTSPDEGTTYSAVKEPQDGVTYYAKFVPSAVLGIKAQVTTDLIADKAVSGTDNSAIRFVTTVDSDKYQEVGFKINRPKSDGSYTTYDTGNGVVYDTLYAVDATKENPGDADTTISPSMFHEASTLFKTWTIKKIPVEFYNADFTVTPYWITLDGTRVEGTQGIRTVNLGRSWIYVDAEATDSTATGTYNEPYTTISDAVAHVTTLSPTVILKDNENDSMAVSETVDITKNVTLTSEGNFTLKRGVETEFKDEFFYVAETGALTLKTIQDDSELILDGAKSEIAATSPLIYNTGALNISEGILLENNSNTSTSVSGGAIYTSTAMNLENVVLSGNDAYLYGGAIFLANGSATTPGKVTLTNVTVQDNATSTKAGGAIYAAKYRELEISGSDTVISGNTAGDTGGAIGTNTGASVTMEAGTISGNQTKNAKDGGAIYLWKASFTMTGGTIKENKAGVLAATSKAGRAGAVFVSAGSTINLSNCEISGNQAYYRAGAIYIDAESALDDLMKFNNVTIKDNKTITNHTGAVYIGKYRNIEIDGKDTLFTGNYSATNAGAICTAEGVNLTMKAGTISGNTANGGDGAGGIYFWSTAACPTTFIVSGGTISGNIDNTKIAPNVRAHNSATIKISGSAKLASVYWQAGVNDIEVTAPLTAENAVTEIAYQSGTQEGTTAVTYTGTADVDMQDLCGRFTLTDTGYTLSVSDKTLLLSAVTE